MKITRNSLTLGVVAIVIIGSIWYLDSLKPHRQTGGNVAVTIPEQTPASSSDRSSVIAQKAKKYPRAVEISNPSGFINTDPFKIQDVIGKKVILIDFWTYSCINCQRTSPYITSWYEKYKDQGLVIIGVHTPEFQFEHDIDNVRAATKKYGITYPVVLDNDYGTWSAYKNQYWPREYLIDIDGFIVYDHAGEGKYDVTEKAIQDALKERAQVLDEKTSIASDMAHPEDAVTVDSQNLGSPETYFGSARNELLGNGISRLPGTRTFQEPSVLQGNKLYLSGSWNIADQYAQNTDAGAKILYKYRAKNVYFVAGSDTPVSVTVMQDGKQVNTVIVKDHTLYTLVENPGYEEHTLELIINQPGLQAYTFTYG